MYRPSMYDKHDETMLNFVEKFNNCPVSRNIEMRPNPVETFDNDGSFIDVNTKIFIGYDWEYRERYFAHCKLAFKSLGQYERKLQKSQYRLRYSVIRPKLELQLGGMQIGFKRKEKNVN